MEGQGTSHAGELVVAVALTGSRKSKDILRWALDKFLPEGNIQLKLIHVYPKINLVPTPMGNWMPISHVQEDVATNYRQEVKRKKMKSLLIYQQILKERKVTADSIVLESDNVATELSMAVGRLVIKHLVIGDSSTTSFFSRKNLTLKKMMGENNLPTLITERVPSFCSVYVIANGKLRNMRPAHTRCLSTVSTDTFFTCYSQPTAGQTMPPETSSPSEQDQDDSETEFVEVDPTGRYGRYKEVLGKGAFKKVYRGFDELEGIEVAWNQVKVSELLRNSEDLERLYSEVHLLKTLKHKNIIKFYNSWVDTKNEHINFITEIFTSGNLRQYRKKHKHVDLRALKKWSRQILEGLDYLHSHEPPVIHRDLKCDNIFVNGNHGEVKIGDLGLAAILHHANAAHSVIGTPEFMAPELYEEDYNELVDIYAFGMCLLELVTFEYPYVECSNAAQIYKKVTSGIKPAALAKVADPHVKRFIEKCIANVSERLTARQLLEDPFLSDADLESIGRSSHDNVQQLAVETSVEVTPKLTDIGRRGLEDFHSGLSRDLRVHGERKDVETIFVKLKIADSKGYFRKIHFPFDIEADTSIAVASEMVHELDLTDQDIPTIAEMIDSEIRALIPDWSPRDSSIDESVFDSHASDSKDESSPVHDVDDNKDETSPLTNASSSLFPDQLPSGRKFWSDSRKAGGEFSPVKSDVHSQSTQDSMFENRHLPGISNLHEEKAVELAYESRGDTECREECDKETKELHEEKAEEGSYEHDSVKVVDNLIENNDKTPDGADSDTQSRVDAECREECEREQKELHEEKAEELAYEHEPVKTVDDQSPDGAVSDSQSRGDAECREECDREKKEINPQLALNGKCDKKHPDIPTGAKTEGLKEGVLSGKTESEELRLIAQNLDILLAEQRKELDELKWKHELALSDMLKELPSEMRLKVFNMCSRKIPDYKMHCVMNICSGHAAEPGSYTSSSQVSNVLVNNGLYNCSATSVERILTRSSSTIDFVSPRIFHVVTKAGKREVGTDGPGYKDKSTSFKRESKSDMGIAVILKDDADES